jgi:hypothetical protein
MRLPGGPRGGPKPLPRLQCAAHRCGIVAHRHHLRIGFHRWHSQRWGRCRVADAEDAGRYDDTPPTSAGYQGNPGSRLSGGTGADNAYYLEGLNVTALRDGMLATNLHVAFLEEAEVVSAGYGAEYGRALGGVVNMALKSGTNEWKGSAFSWVQPGWMAGSHSGFLSRSTVLTGTTEPDYTTQMGSKSVAPSSRTSSLSGWAMCLRSAAAASFNTRIASGMGTVSRTPTPMARPLSSRSTRRVIPGESTTHNYAGKLTWRIRPDQTLSLSLVGIRKDQEYMRGANMDLLAGMTHDQSSRQDIIAHWQSAFFQRQWRIDATLGLHTEGYSQRSPYGDAESMNDVTWNNLSSFARAVQSAGGIHVHRRRARILFPRVLSRDISPVAMDK